MVPIHEIVNLALDKYSMLVQQNLNCGEKIIGDKGLMAKEWRKHIVHKAKNKI